MKQVAKKSTSQNRNSKSKAGGAVAAVPKKTLSKWVLLPLVIAIAVIPLITIVHKYDCGLEKNNWFSPGGLVYDFFLYYKSFFLKLLAVIVLFLLAYLVPVKDHSFLKVKRNLPPTIAIGIFGLFSLGSAILADDKNAAFFGGYEQFEGWFVLLAYVGCFFLAFGYARTIETIRFILDAVLIGATIAGLLGFFQALGMDWIQSSWAKPFLGLEVDLTGFNVKLNFGEGMSYITLYNPNYVGSYVALVFPYCFYLIFRGEKIWRRCLAGISSILLIVSLLASQSKTGIAGLAAGALVGAILILPYIKKVFRIIIIAAGAIAIIGGAVFLISRGYLSGLSGSSDTNQIDSMTCEGSTIHIRTEKGQKFDVALDEAVLTDPEWARNYFLSEILKITDDSGNPVSTTVEDKVRITIDEPGYPTISFFPEARPITDEQGAEAGEMCILHVDDPGFDWSLVGKDNKLMIYNDYGRLDNLRKIEKAGFEGNYWFASRRGYIWSRTFPMLDDCILLGKGPDSFINAFPNDDYVGKQYVYYGTQSITKPHDMFLQIWIQDGLVCLLAFLFLYIFLIVRAFRLCYGKNKVEGGKGITFHGFTIITAVATTAYIIVGLANDSTITVAPIYWCLLGAGYAAESMCRQNN